MGGNFVLFRENNIPPVSHLKQIYVDTNFLLRCVVAFAGGKPWIRKACRKFAYELIANNVYIVTSDFALEEAFFIPIKAIYCAEIDKINLTSPDKYNKAQWDRLYKDDSSLINLGMPVIEQISKTINELPVFVHRPSDNVEDLVISLMKDYSLLSADAYQLAIAIDAGIENVVTLDKDFMRVLDSGLVNIYSPYARA